MTQRTDVEGQPLTFPHWDWPADHWQCQNIYQNLRMMSPKPASGHEAANFIAEFFQTQRCHDDHSNDFARHRRGYEHWLGRPVLQRIFDNKALGKDDETHALRAVNHYYYRNQRLVAKAMTWQTTLRYWVLAPWK